MHFWPFKCESAGEKRQREIINELKLLKTIMAKTNAELIADIQALTTQLTLTTAIATSTKEQVVKIGTETDGLLKTIQDLKDAMSNQNSPTPELVAAVDAAVAQAAVLQTEVEAGKAKAQEGDAKVDDALPTP